MSVRVWTPEEWWTSSTLDAGARQADGCDHAVIVPVGAGRREYTLIGAGNLTVLGGGHATAHGGNATAHGGDATAHGGHARAYGGNATAHGGNAMASGGHAWVSGGGNATAHGGNATAHGGGDARAYGGNAWVSGGGNATASGGGVETDHRGTRWPVESIGIGYECLAGGGWLRVGCELHSLSDWVARAEEIDAKHGDGIAARTRALAERLLAVVAP